MRAGPCGAKARTAPTCEDTASREPPSRPDTELPLRGRSNPQMSRVPAEAATGQAGRAAAASAPTADAVVGGTRLEPFRHRPASAPCSTPLTNTP